MRPHFLVIFGITCLSVADSESCFSRCHTTLQPERQCQCNSVCSRYADCCSDYEAICDEIITALSCNLSCIATHLWNNDVNRMQMPELQVNFQGQTTSRSRRDRAHLRLFTQVPHRSLSRAPTFRTFTALLDNYDANLTTPEATSSAERREIDNFLNAILETRVMNLTFNFLRQKGYVTSSASFRTILKDLWFHPYRRARRDPVNSSGFEHVMVGEHTSRSVSGFHSWIQFYLEEKRGHIDYKGWIRVNMPSVLGARFTWHGLTKSKGSFFIGVSPEFDIAIYTICALVRQNTLCTFNMNGNNVKIKTFVLNQRNRLRIASAYPVV